MTTLFLLTASIQGLALLVDEFYFHYRRGLPRWERIGHPVDTLSFIAPLAMISFLPKTEMFEWAVIILSVLSCLCITKDEWIHAVHSSAAENWLHSVLFILHPVILIAAYGNWTTDVWLVRGLLFLSFGFFVYQILYWNFLRRDHQTLS